MTDVLLFSLNINLSLNLRDVNYFGNLRIHRYFQYALINGHQLLRNDRIMLLLKTGLVKS